MKSVYQFFKQFPLSIIVYLCYTLLVLMILRIEWRIKNTVYSNHGERLVVGEGLMYGLLFLFLFAIIYGITILINALIKKQSKFYWWLLLAIIAPLIVVINF